MSSSEIVEPLQTVDASNQEQEFKFSNVIYPIVIEENSTNTCRFNVMQDKFVEEIFFLKEYRVYPEKIEATFDRQYHSDMLKSPNHLVFLTLLAHTQKLLYVYLCHLFYKKYQASEPEKIKIWATKVEIELPKLVTDTSNVVQALEVLELKKIQDKQYIVKFRTNVAERIVINASCNIYEI